METAEFEKEMLKAWRQRDNPEMIEREWVKGSATVQLGTVSITFWADEMKKPSLIRGRVESTELNINDEGEMLENLAKTLQLRKRQDRVIEVGTMSKPDCSTQKQGHFAFAVELQHTSFVTEVIRFVRDVQIILNAEIHSAQLSFVEITTKAFKVSLGKETESLP
jgi:hypothetical protein